MHQALWNLGLSSCVLVVNAAVDHMWMVDMDMSQGNFIYRNNPQGVFDPRDLMSLLGFIYHSLP